jgi:hypothetical protein
MADRAQELNELLKSHDAPPIKGAALSLQNINAFLKEAYRIVRSSVLHVSIFAYHTIEQSHSFAQYLPQEYPRIISFDCSSAYSNVESLPV